MDGEYVTQVEKDDEANLTSVKSFLSDKLRISSGDGANIYILVKKSDEPIPGKKELEAEEDQIEIPLSYDEEIPKDILKDVHIKY